MYPYVSMHDVSKCVHEELRTSGCLLGYRMTCKRFKLKHRIVINNLKQTGGGMALAVTRHPTLDFMGVVLYV